MAGALLILVTTPHCSGEIPDEIFTHMRRCGVPEPILRKRIFAEGDPFTDQLYDIPATTAVCAHYSRFVADLNRERDEEGPNGVIKTTDFQLRPLYPPGYRVDARERERRLREYYDPFHDAVEKILSKGDVRFLLDGHSMTAQGPAMGPDEGGSRPALCLCNFGDGDGEPVAGISVSFDPVLTRRIRDRALESAGSVFPDWDQKSLVLLNHPFDGGHILKRYTDSAYPNRVPGLMFEINRALYLNENTLEPIPGAIETWKGILREITSFLYEILA